VLLNRTTTNHDTLLENICFLVLFLSAANQNIFWYSVQIAKLNMKILLTVLTNTFAFTHM